MSAVTDVTNVQVNSSTIELSYTAPPTLDGIPISNYSIDISNNNEIYWTTENNIQLTFADPCTNYTVEISAWNTVGKGAIYYLPLTIYNSKLLMTAISTETTSLYKFPLLSIVYPSVPLSPNFIPDNVTISLTNNYISVTTKTEVCLKCVYYFQ